MNRWFRPLTLGVAVGSALLLAACERSTGGDPAAVGSIPTPSQPESAASGDASSDPRPPNVLLVTLDTTRPDRLGAYGHAPAQTPAFDGLAAAGTLFEQAFTPVPLTLPAHATLLTGLQPPEHGVRINGGAALGEAPQTLAERLGTAGYATGAFTAAFVVDGKFGLDQGFETYDDDLSEAYEQLVAEPLSVYRSGHLVVDAAQAWLEQAAGGERPFFAWVHLYDAHYPYHGHPALDGTLPEGAGGYDAELAFADRQLARLLEFLGERGLRESTLVVVVGDHGEGLGDHLDDIEHGYLLFEEVLHVPLVVSWPGVVRAGRRVPGTVELRDLYPTLLDLALGGPSSQGGGRSLRPALVAGEPLTPRAAYAETELPFTAFHWSAMRALTTPEWKYVRSTRPELYDRRADPEELFNLASARPGERETLEAELTALEAELLPAAATEAVDLDAEESARLAALGYVTGESGAEAPEAASRTLPDGEPLPDAKDRIRAKHLSAELASAQARGTATPDDVLRMRRELVATSPETPSFRLELATLLLDRGEPDAALEQLEAAAALVPHDPDVHYAVAEGLFRAGRVDAAEGHYRAALARAPGFAAAHVGLGNVYAQRGQAGAAAGHYQEALRLRPGYPEAHYNLGLNLRGRGRRGLAVDHYTRALDGRPDWRRARFDRANVLRELGRLDEAIADYETILAANPDDVDVLNNLGVSLAAAGRPDEAEALYRRAAQLAPEFHHAHTNLANLYSNAGRWAEALRHYEAAAALLSAQPGPAQRLAWLLATCPDETVRDGPRAVEYGERARAQSAGRDPNVLDALAAAYAEAGRFEEAVAAAGEAVGLAEARAQAALAAEVDARRALYTAGTAYRLTESLSGIGPS